MFFNQSNLCISLVEQIRLKMILQSRQGTPSEAKPQVPQASPASFVFEVVVLELQAALATCAEAGLQF